MGLIIPHLANRDFGWRGCYSGQSGGRGTSVSIEAGDCSRPHPRQGLCGRALFLPVPTLDERLHLRDELNNLEASLLQCAARARMCRARERPDLWQPEHPSA